MKRTVFRLLAAGSLCFMGLSLSAVSAGAWSTSHKPRAKACYKKVHTPPRYRTVARRVMVSRGREHVETIPARYEVRKRRVVVEPQRVSWHKTPARYEVRARNVLVRQARRVPYTTPAEYRTVFRDVLVKPAGYEWTIKYDAHGEPVHCKVPRPAVYSKVAEKELVRPSRTHYQTVPAEYRTVHEKVLVHRGERRKIVHPARYGYVQEKVMVSPARRIVRRSAPVYRTVHERVLVSHGSSGWVRVRVPGC